jgi:replicative DNA helicase
MGKTQLLVNISLNISVSTPVLYFTFDLSEFLLTSRFISSLSGIAVNKILQHELTDEQKENLASIETKFANHKILVNDSCNNSISALKAHCQKQIQENGVKVIVVDYLQMMSSNKYRNSRELEISFITRELKNIAKDFNVCVIASSQLSRAVESRGGLKHPQLSDLRESGAIEQDADKVIFIYRPEYYGLECDEDGNSTAGVTELILAKNRNGSLGTVKLLRDANFTNYRDFDQYKNEFSFSQSRLDELIAKNPNIKTMIDNLGLDETPF